MANIPMEILRTFVTVIDMGSFTLAGDLLGRSQPAVSLQIKRLEELLEQTLITRIGQAIDLTLAGRPLYDYAKRILALNDEAIALYKTTNISGQIKLGIPSEFATSLLPKIVSQFTQRYPNVHLEVISDLSRNLLAESPRKKYDLVLVLHEDPRKAGKQLIKEEELVWVTSTNHNINLQSTLQLIAAPEGCLYRHRATRELNKANIAWQIIYTNPDLSGIQSAIESGLGVTVLTKSTVPESLKIVPHSKNFPALGKVGISLKRKKGTSTEAVQRLEEYLKTHLTI